MFQINPGLLSQVRPGRRVKELLTYYLRSLTAAARTPIGEHYHRSKNTSEKCGNNFLGPRMCHN